MAAQVSGATLVALPGRDYPPYIGDVDAVVNETEAFLTGQRHQLSLDRILSTVLFTDIVGSTQQLAELGDARWAALLAAHDDLARREIERHRGHYIDSTGDGLLASFDGPARAVRCAQALGAALGELGLDIRAGCHTGEIELAGDRHPRPDGSHRRPGRCARSRRGGSGQFHSERPHRGLGAAVPRRRRARTERRPRPVASLPGTQLTDDAG